MNSKKKILIIICGVLSICTIGYTIFYAIKHYNEGEVIGTDKINIYYTSAGQLDSVTMPNPNENITLKKLPETNDTLTEINFDTMKKLFKTNKKSILALEKDDCSYCQDYEPKLIEALKDNSAQAYKLNISKLTNEEISKIYKYIDFTGTPTTYIIENGKVSHSFTGTTDKDTLSAFIEYFYVRNE